MVIIRLFKEYPLELSLSFPHQSRIPAAELSDGEENHLNIFDPKDKDVWFQF